MSRNRIASLPTLLPSSSPSQSQPRRRQSIIELFSAFQAPLLSRPSLSYNQDYSNIPTAQERILKAIQLFQKDVLDPFEDDPTAENLKEEIKTFISSQIGKGLTNAEADELKYDIIVKLATEKKEFDPFRVMKVFGKFVLSYFDTTTDILVAIMLAGTNSTMAIVQGTTLLFSFVVQSVTSYAFGQPMWVVLSGMFGMKPIVEAWRDATNAKPFPNQKVPNENMLIFSRNIEITTEAIPQSIIQTLVLIIVPISYSSQLPLPFLLLCDYRLPCSFRRQRI